MKISEKGLVSSFAFWFVHDVLHPCFTKEVKALQSVGVSDGISPGQPSARTAGCWQGRAGLQARLQGKRDAKATHHGLNL